MFNRNFTNGLPSPNDVRRRLPCPPFAARTVERTRETLRNILHRRDHRLFMVVGPCSIHDTSAGLEYAHRLHALQQEVADVLILIMRAYFEKPRTTVGWKGYLNDPALDGSFQIDRGIEQSRQFLLDVCSLGLATATEALDPSVPLYLEDLVCWHAIGARTTESQTHREMASGLSTPVGFKNGTDGDVQAAVNSCLSAKYPHSFIGIDTEGRVGITATRGNRDAHLVLRGGKSGPNYGVEAIAVAEQAMRRADLQANIVVDCSHANSAKDPARQGMVLRQVLEQVCNGNQSIVGVMLESNLVAGNQSIPDDLSQLAYGCSITDACLDWDTTRELISDAATVLRASTFALRRRCNSTEAPGWNGKEWAEGDVLEERSALP